MLRTTCLTAAMLLVSCGKGLNDLAETGQASPAFVETTVAAESLPPFDSTRTYHDLSSTVVPDSVLRDLAQAGFIVTAAWQPLEDVCTDPVGPRFTVQLAAPDDRMLTRGFAAGPGRFLCVLRVRQYVPHGM